MTDLQHIKLSDIPVSFDAKLHRMRTYGYRVVGTRSAHNEDHTSSPSVKVIWKSRDPSPPWRKYKEIK